LKTFALELEWKYGEENRGGWFLDRERLKDTSHWMLVWPRTAGQPLKQASDIVRAEAVLIGVEKMRNWVRRKASKETGFLEDVMRELREGDEDELPWAGLRIRISRKLPEQPINLLMSRDILRELSNEMHWTLP